MKTQLNQVVRFSEPRSEHTRQTVRCLLGRFFAVSLCAASALICAAQRIAPPPERLPPMLGQVLSWLPADTETILVVGRSFVMPAFSPEADRQGHKVPPDRILDLLPLDRFALREGLLQDYFAGETVELAIEGSRHFRNPSGLGEAPYEGCQIAVLKNADPVRGTSFRAQWAGAALRTDTVAGQPVLMFQERLENDVWTTFVAFPRPNLVMACTNSDYLREVIERTNGKAGRRALPETLAEWSFVETRASFWGLRHYDKSQAGRDPTSPFAGPNALGVSDARAVGVTVAFGSETQGVARLHYLSGATDILDFLQKRTPLSMHVEGLVPSTVNLPIRYRRAAPGVEEIEYDLGDAIPVEAFLSVIIGVFGHPVYF